MPIEYINGINSSLKLIAAQGLQIRVYTPYDRRRVQANFIFGGVNYHLWVTDPVIESQYYAQADGLYNLGAKYLTVSLSEPYQGGCYKVVAAIIGEHP